MYYNSFMRKNLSQHPLTNNARKALGNDVILHYRTFNQTWSDTGTVWAYPGSGILVGHAFTTKKVAVFYGKRGAVAVYVGSELVYTIDKPNEAFKVDIHNQQIDYIKFAKDRYEKVDILY